MPREKKRRGSSYRRTGTGVQSLPARRAFSEPLECRILLSALQWIPEGPAPNTNAGNTIGPTPATSDDVGAVEALAVDPFNQKHVFAGSVNGGIWQTQDFTVANPVWTTTTDQMPSLSINSIAFSPVNESVIYAGTGDDSSLSAGGPAVGVYKSINGGASWQVENPNGIFSGLRIIRIIPTSLNGGQTVFAATTDGPNGGVFRSDTGGASWTRVSGTDLLPNSGVTDLVENPANPNQFYAAISGTLSSSAGVYRLDLGVSTNWVNVTNDLAGTDLTGSLRIELSVSPAGANPVWASIINTSGYYQRIYRGVPSGGTINWGQVGPPGLFALLPPDLYGDNQGSLHGAILADPNSDSIVYLSGSATPNGAGAGDIVRGDSVANTWTSLVKSATKSSGDAGTILPIDNGDTTAPHADSRALVFAYGGVLLNSCDGGVYQGTNPESTASGAQTWTSVNGSLQISEMYNISYDSQFHIIFGGDQDTGTPSQTAPGSLLYTDQSGGDGGSTAVDDLTLGGVGESIRYFFGGTRKIFNSANGRPAGDVDSNILPQAGLAGLTSASANDLFNGTVVDAVGPTAAQIAAGQSTQVVVSGNAPNKNTPGAVYESNDAGTASDGAPVVINGRTFYFVNDTWTKIPTGPGFQSVNTINANASNEAVMAYGGKSDGTGNPDVLYVASGSQIFLRTAAGGTLTATPAQPAGAGTITGIVLDPNDWKTAFVTDNFGVYMTTDAGEHWTTITGNLTNQANLNARLAVIQENGYEALLFGGSHGVLSMLVSNPGVWTQFGNGLPNVNIGGLVYNAADNVVVVGTLGRGAWELQLPPVIYVDSFSFGPVENGSSWADAFDTLQSALAVATSGTIIEVAAGNYSPGASATSTFQLEDGVTIQGGYAVGGSSEPEPNVHVTNLIGSGVNYHVVTGSGTNATAILNGFYISGGNADGSSLFTQIGGGMLNDIGSPQVINCTFSQNSANSAVGSGGGMANYSSSPYVVNCRFFNNTTASGGGMFNYNSSPDLLNDIFKGNTASDLGGGIFNESSPDTIANCTFTANSGVFGGAIAYVLGSGSLFNSILWNDSSANGEIYVSASTPNVSYCDVTGGYASGSHIIATDPLFAPNNVDYELQPGSPAIGDGNYAAASLLISLTGVQTDVAGGPRTRDGSIDLGATESQTIYVDTLAAGLGVGSSWAYAYKNLAPALSAAAAVEASANTVGGGLSIPIAVYVAQGTYYPGSFSSPTSTFQLIDDVTIEGGFAGGINPNAPQNVALYSTIVNGFSSFYHLFTGSGTDSTAVLDGFTIVGGDANDNGNTNNSYGGGIINVSGNPTIENCYFNGNYAGGSLGGGGGAMYNLYSAPTIINCAFDANFAHSGNIGGAVIDFDSTPKFTNCTFTANNAGTGAAIYNEGNSNSTLTNCIVWGDVGGGTEIYNLTFEDDSSATVTYSDVQGGYSGAGNINANPLFVSSSNLQLQFGSPAINTGNNTAIAGFAKDLAGNPRIAPANGIVDMGAYEYQGPFVIYVDQSATHGANNGSSWADAYTSLQSALAVASAGFTIDVAQGDYSPGNTAASTFQLKNGVIVQGGFATGGSTTPSPSTHVTYLDGSNVNYHVVTGSGVTTATELLGFTIKNGKASGGGENSNGAGLYDNGGSPELFNCIFTNDNATLSGGAIANENSSSPFLFDCLFTGNTAGSDGGAIFNENGSAPYTVNCAFYLNTGSSAGGAVYNYQSNSYLINCTFTANTSVFGGAVFNGFCNPTITNTILWNDSAPDSPEIYVESSTPAVTYSDIQGGFTGTGNINANPLFVNATNLQLQNGSPCYNAGNNNALALVYLAGYTTDLAGNPRIAFGTVDMGAYEYQGPTVLVFAQEPSATIVTGSNAGQVIVNVEKNGTPISDGTTVTLSISGNPAGVSLTGNTAVVNSAGQAVFNNLVVSGTSGSYTLTAKDGNDTPATSGSFNLTAQVNTTPAMFYLTPPPPSVTAGAVLPPVVVEVELNGARDFNDNSSISLVLINLANDSYTTVATMTANQGVATFTGLVFNTTGSFDLVTSDGNYSISTVGVTVTAPVVTTTLVFGPIPFPNFYAGQTVTPGLTVTEVPSSGTLNDNSSFVTLALIQSPAGATVTGTLIEKVTNNVATFGNLTFSTPGTYEITATDGNDTVNTLAFEVSAPAVTTLAFTKEPPATFALAPNVPVTEFEVSVQQNGVTIDDNSMVEVIVSIPSAAPYGGMFVIPAVHGVAKFNDFFLGQAVLTTLKAFDLTNPSDIPAVATQINVTPGPATYLIVSALATSAGSSTTVTVGAHDEVGNNIPNYSGTVMLTITDPNGNVVATPTAAASGGLATFSNLIFDLAGNYSISATDVNTGIGGGGGFTVFAAQPSKLAFGLQPGPAASGFPIQPSFTIDVEDQFNNLVANDNSAITVSLAPGGTAGAALGGQVTVNAQDGIATFDTVSVNLPGMYHLNAADGSYAGTTSNGFTISPPLTLYVDQSAASGDNTGLDWADAFTSLQSALAVAVDGDRIDVAQGDYSPGTDPTSTFQLIDGVIIQGGYQSGGLSGPNPTLYPAMLDGQNTNYHVVTANGTNFSAVLDGFTITGGNANGGGNADSAFGGGLLADGGSPTIQGCTFTGNTAVDGGAAYLNYEYDTGATFTGCVFSNNSATTSGGALYDSYSTVTMVNCLFYGNSAVSDAAAVDAIGSTPIITNCTFTLNTASYGGAIEADYGSDPTVTNSIFWNDTAGGEINYYTAATVTYSDVSGGMPGTGNLNVDPMFVNPAGANFQLQESSLCIDAGSNDAPALAGVTTDLAGNNRIVNGIVDQGAYEAPILATIYVDHTATGPNNGTSWANAYTSLAAALAVAVPGDRVDVAQGDYSPGADPTATFQLISGMVIQGGYETGGLNGPNPAAYPTILDGMNNNYHVVTGSGVNYRAVLNGFTIAGGDASGNGDDDSGFGGGMIVNSGTPTIIDCTFIQNTALLGGAVYDTNPGFNNGLTLIDCSFTDNSAMFNGGAIENYYASPTIVGCLFTGNTAVNSGGAVYNFSSLAILTNCTFTLNSGSVGGAIECDFNSDPTITNSILWNDTATGGNPGANEIYTDGQSESSVTYSDIDDSEYAFTSTNIDADPKFVSPLTGNFQLQPTSPAINAGSNAAINATGVTTDLAGNPRIFDGVVDMGAYEAQAVSIYWTGADDGFNWSDPLNWSDNQVPTQFDTVTIGAGFGNIQVNGGVFPVGALNAASPLEIVGGSMLQLFAPAVTDSTLTIDAGGTLDIQSYKLTVNFAAGNDPYATYRGYLKSAYMGGVWTGTGLTSGTVEAQVANAIANPGGGVYAIGYEDGSRDLTQSVAVGNQLVFEPAIVGDTDLNGTTNFLDLGRVAQNLGSINADWAHGDFNYDGSVNFLDIGLLAQNLNKSKVNTPLIVAAQIPAGAIFPAAAGLAVPAPALRPANTAAARFGNMQYDLLPDTMSATFSPASTSSNLLFGDNQLADVLD